MDGQRRQESLDQAAADAAITRARYGECNRYPRFFGRLIRRVVEAIGLSRPAFRLYEWLVALKAPPEAQDIAEDGLPVPPPRLRILVAGHTDVSTYLRFGLSANQAIRSAIASAGMSISDLDGILDLGCGCGRIARHWQDLRGTRLLGCDYNPRMVLWCRKHLPFMETFRNELAPPLALPSDSLGLVYAYSVFTHFPADLQLQWLNEVRRILRPGGLFWFTLQGEGYHELIPRSLRDAFASGELVVRDRKMAGTNLCSAYHPRAYVESQMSAGFEILGMWPTSPPGQDAWLFRRLD